MEPDLVLLDRFRQTGDAAAFGEIVRRYAGAVFATCQRILHDHSSAEDAAQETFYRLMTRPQRVSASLGGWLHRAATRLALDIRRSDLARRRRESTYEPALNPEASTWAEVAPLLDEALVELAEEDRELLARHFLRGEPQAELAMEAGTSAATMSRRIKTAVEALRTELERRGVGMSPALLLGLMLQHGHGAAPATLQIALAKMSLYCTARASGIATGATAGSTIGSIAKALHGARWALAAAAFSLAATLVAAMIVQHCLKTESHSLDNPPPRVEAADFNTRSASPW